MSDTIQVRVRLSASAAAPFLELPPAARAIAVAGLLTGAVQGVQLPNLIAATDELRRLGVNLNQALKMAHGRGALDPDTVDRVKSVLALIERLRGRA
jgi:hypothetical protein